MRWKRILERYGFTVEEEGVEVDPFFTLGEMAKSGEIRSTVSSEARRSLDYGQVGCKVYISMQCPQNESSINLAAEIAFKKALELTNDGMQLLANAPRIPEEIE